MKKIFAILLSALALGGCENDGIPYVSLGLDDLYKVARMQTVDLKPAFTGESYRWTVKTASGADSLLSEEKNYIFLMQYPGTYDVTFQIFDPVNPIVHRMTFYVVEEEVEYSPYISTVYEYCPAPGQFVNAMPEYREGDTAETMRQKAEEAIAGKMQSGVSLGAYGGYITFGFDHTVVNVPGEYDIRIDGNSFNSAAHPGVDGGSSEPGIIMVMFDENQNGKPDDKWYEIDKNPWYTDEAATYGYEITYHRPAPDHVPTPGEGNDSALTDMTYIKWEDNRGQTDYVYKNKFHDQDYYPKWIDADEMTFRGTLLPKNAVDVSGNGSYYLQYMFKYGAYADNYPNEAKDENGNYNRLEHPNIDTGMGLERMACIMQGVTSIFEVDTIRRVLDYAASMAGVEYGRDEKTDVSLRVITDHIRSTVFLVSDGVLPDNEGRGYVLRRATADCSA